jgi:membrane associated rhomboid family serine protease
LGPLRYLLLYFGSGVAAAMTQVLPDPTSNIPMVGASGAIAGVLGAYLMIYPRANVHVFVWIIIFFRIVAVPAWLMLGFWFGMQLLSAISTGPNEPGVAFWAHAGGFVAGCMLVLLLRPPRVSLLQPQKSPFFAVAPPTALTRRRTFHGGSVPEVRRRPPPGTPPGRWP